MCDSLMKRKHLLVITISLDLLKIYDNYLLWICNNKQIILNNTNFQRVMTLSVIYANTSKRISSKKYLHIRKSFFSEYYSCVYVTWGD